MKRAGGGILVVLALLLMLVAGWIGLRPYVLVETAEVAVVLPDGDPNAEAALRGLQLSREQSGPRAGRFRVRFRDLSYGSSPMSASNDVADILSTFLERDPDLVAVLGTGDYSSTWTLAPPLNLEDTVLLSPYLTDASLTRPGSGHLGHPAGVRPNGKINYFGIFAPDELIAARVIRWARDLGARSVALIPDETFQSLEFAGRITPIFASSGLRVSARGFVVDPSQANAEVLQGIDLLILAAWDRRVAAGVLKKVRRDGFKGRIVCTDEAMHPGFLSAAGKDAEGVRVVAGLPQTPPEFDAAFRDTFGTQPPPAAYGGYLAGERLLDAIAQAAEKSPGAVRNAFESLDFFNEHGEPLDPVVSLYVVRNGRFEFVEELKE